MPFPAVTVCDAGLTESEKSVTCKVTFVAWLRLPLAPVIVRVELAAGVELLVVTVIVDEPGAVVEAGLKLTLVPVGCPPALREIVPVKALMFPRFTV